MSEPDDREEALEALERLADYFSVVTERYDISKEQLWRMLLEQEQYGADDERVREWCRWMLRVMDEQGLGK